MAENRYQVGRSVTLSGAFWSDTAMTIPGDPTAVTFYIKTPDGVIVPHVYGTDLNVIRDGTGKYHYVFLITQAGWHSYRYVGTGTIYDAQEMRFFVIKSDFV